MEGSVGYRGVFGVSFFLLLVLCKIPAQELQSSNGMKQYCVPRLLAEWNALYGDRGSMLASGKTVLDAQSFVGMVQAVEQSNRNMTGGHVINATDDTVKSNELMHIRKAVLSVGSTVYCWGDIHGDISSLLSAITYLREQQIIDDQLRIVQPNTYIVSCGDFVDRGEHGAEVLYLLCLLKQQNPDNVFLVRGNHEEVELNTRYGFYKECCEKFSPAGVNDLFSKVLISFYASLPVALYVGIERERRVFDFIQFCHGGLEFYDLRSLLAHPDKRAVEMIRSLNRSTVCVDALGCAVSRYYHVNKSAITAIADTVTTPSSTNIGFMWSDFNAGYRYKNQKIVPTDSTVTYYTPSRGFMFGRHLTEALATTIGGEARIVSIIRAHQHNASMPQLVSQAAMPNRSIYKLFSQDSPQVTVITTVLTTGYAPGRGFVKIEFPSADSGTWTLQGLWQARGDSSVWEAHQKNTFAAWYNPVG